MTAATGGCPVCGFTPAGQSVAKTAAAMRRHSCARHLRLAAQAAARQAREQAQAAVTPTDCTHPGAPHRHGTNLAYVRDRCGCCACREAHRVYSQGLRKRHVYGRFEAEWVDAADTVGAHVEALLATGWTVTGIMRAAGAGRRSIPVPQPYGRSSPSATTIRRDIADRILAIAPNPPPVRSVDATGTRRRLQALAALGWPLDAIAERCGVNRRTLSRALADTTVTVTLAARVAAAYDQLSMTRGPSAGTRGRAARRGWAPPLAWDDETIDDPATQPCGLPSRGDRQLVDDVAVDRFLAGNPVSLTRPERAAVAARLAGQGHSVHAVARRLGTGAATVRNLLRAG